MAFLIKRGRPKKRYGLTDTAETTFFCQLDGNEFPIEDIVFVRDRESRLLRVCQNHKNEFGRTLSEIK